MALSNKAKRIVDEKNQRIEDVPNNLYNKIGGVQRDLFSEMTSLLNELETQGGNIIVNEENLLRVEQIMTQFRQSIPTTDYNESLSVFADEFDTQADLNDEYFDEIGEDAPEEARTLNNNNKRNSIRKMVGGSLDAPFYNPITDTLNDAVANGSSLRDTIEALRLDIEGDQERLGHLDRYVRQIATDAFAQADRSYTQAVASGLELEWSFYSGGLVEDTRAFCQCRNGKWFHNNEIQAWGRGEDLNIEGCTPTNTKGEKTTISDPWQGKNPNTNETTIFTLLGGYNCLHSLMPGTLAVVPQDVVLRNIENGNFEPTAFQRDFLGI